MVYHEGMVIGFDGSRAFNSHRTGTENYSFQVLKHLAKIDHQNTYLVYLRPDTKIDGEWPDNFMFKTLNFPRLWTQIGLAWQTFKDPLDVLFVPAHTLPLIHRPNLKTVLTVHDLGAEYLPQMHQLKQRLYLKLMTDYQLRSATHLIAVSEATKRDIMAKVQVPSSRIRVIYEGYNPDLKLASSDAQRDILKQYDIEKDRYFLFVGTIQPRKNIARLIQAFHLYQQQTKDTTTKLVLAGSKGWLSEPLYQLPQQLGIADSVKFLGYVPDSNLSTLYHHAIAFVFPSLFEGFGLPVLEAFACNCPVITSNTSSLPEVAGEGAVLVDPLDVEALAGALKTIQDKALQSKLKPAGIKQLAKFSWQQTSSQIIDLLTKIVK